MPSWIQDPVTHKLIPREQYDRANRKERSFVQEDLKPFVSPIDGKPVYTRRQLREHNKRHGVTDMRDYGEEWFTRKASERKDILTGNGDQAARVEAIRQALYLHGVID
jgi:hypothetical protein